MTGCAFHALAFKKWFEAGMRNNFLYYNILQYIVVVSPDNTICCIVFDKYCNILYC